MSDLFIPTIGVVYSMKFIDGYTTTDGVYRVVKLMTYDEYLSDGGDMVSTFFEVNGKTEADMESLLSTSTDTTEAIREDKIMKLELPDTMADDSVIYAPLSFLAETQDHNVSAYKKLGLLCYIGITDDSELLDLFKTQITRTIEAEFGITPDPQFVSVGEVYLTDEEYSAEVAKRDASKLSTTNYVTELKATQLKLSQAYTLIQAYEEILKTLYTQSNQGQVSDG